MGEPLGGGGRGIIVVAGKRTTMHGDFEGLSLLHSTSYQASLMSVQPVPSKLVVIGRKPAPSRPLLQDVAPLAASVFLCDDADDEWDASCCYCWDSWS